MLSTKNNSIFPNKQNPRIYTPNIVTESKYCTFGLSEELLQKFKLSAKKIMSFHFLEDNDPIKLPKSTYKNQQNFSIFKATNRFNLFEKDTKESDDEDSSSLL